MSGAGDALSLLVAAGCLLAVSGIPGLLLARLSPSGPRLAALLAVIGSGLGVAGCALALAGAPARAISFAAAAPGARFELGVDALTAWFALPAFVIGALGSIYGLAYWPPAARPRNGRRLRFCFGTLLGGITFVTLSRDGLGFLVAWEAMALSGYFLVTTDEASSEARKAGWLYLIFSHAGTLCLVGLFAGLGRAGGGFALRALAPGAVGGRAATLLFFLALIGFGIKAGAMPLHSWLPAAHAAAPSHVSAVMSGVMLNMGLYGIVRVASLLPSPPVAWGAALLLAGGLSALLAIALALAQSDLKRLLAYSSIENIGIMLLGLGLAMVGRTLDRPEWVVLGLAGCLLHMWNHALFKSLLFLGAGSVMHGAGTRDLERTGGLARRMPVTAGLFLLGSAAICGLPPLNGFVSELLVYLGLVRAAIAPGTAWAALPAPALAATGALAVACFVKVYGVVFLGTARTVRAARAHESPGPMLGAMAVLAAGCVAIGAAPGLVAPALDRAVRVWIGEGSPLPPLPGVAEVAPLSWMPVVAVALVAVLALAVVSLSGVWRRARARQSELPTWDCGYAVSSPRLQYTASSFADAVTSRFAWALRPRVRRPRVEELFPAPSRFHSHVDDPVLGRLVLPRARKLREALVRARLSQQGNLQDYVLYIVVAIAVLFLFNFRFDWLVNELCRP